MSLFDGIAGLVGSEDAEDAQFAAMQRAEGISRERYGQAEDMLNPFIKGGSGAQSIIDRLFGLDGQPADMSAFTASPGYQFRQQQGQQAVERSAAAKGGLFSGAAGKALTNYGQNTASQEFDNYLARLFGVAGSGQNAAANLGSLGAGNAAQLGSIYQTIGNNQANATMSQANAIGEILNSGAAAAMGGMNPAGGFGMAGGAGSSMNAAQSLFGV